jgi:hypothetical protein
MSRIGQVWVACCFTFAGACAAMGIIARASAVRAERLAGIQ